MNLTRQTQPDRAGTQTTPVAPLNNDPGTQRITSPTLQATALSTDDRLAIYELIALHGHLMDSGAFDRLHQLFTHDFVYDVQALGFGLLKGTEALTEASRTLGRWESPGPSRDKRHCYRRRGQRGHGALEGDRHPGRRHERHRRIRRPGSAHQRRMADRLPHRDPAAPTTSPLIPRPRDLRRGHDALKSRISP